MDVRYMYHIHVVHCTVVVNTSNDEKQVCSVHHGVYKNSYSPYGGWYNASTDTLVALVKFETFCVVKLKW